MDGIKSLMEFARGRVAFPASCLGVGFVSTWTELSFINPPVGFPNAPEFTFLLFNASSVVVALITAICVRGAAIKTPLVSDNKAVSTALALMLVAICMNFFLIVSKSVPGWLFAVSAVIGGSGLALLFVMWFEVVSRLNPVQMLLCYAFAAVGRVSIIWLCGGMNVDRLWASVVAISILSILLLKIADQSVIAEGVVETRAKAEEAVRGKRTQSCSFPLKPLLVVLSGTVTLSFVLGSVDNAWGTNGNPGVLFAAAIVILAVMRSGDHFEFRRLWQLSLVFLIVGIAFFVVGGSVLSHLAGCMVCASYEFCLMLIYSILSDLVYRSYYNPTFLFSAELALALSAGSFGGWASDLMGVFFSGVSTVSFVLTGCLLAILFASASIYAFSSRNLEGKWSVIVDHPIAQDIDLLLEHSRLGLRCHCLSEEVGLSRREEEVLLLTAQGKKPSVIAKQLGIAPSTVTTHKKHIYQKLDVHSAKDLRARIENDRDV